MTRLRAEIHIVWEYDADPEFYEGETDPVVMAATDESNMTESDSFGLEYVPDPEKCSMFTIAVTPVVEPEPYFRNGGAMACGCWTSEVMVGDRVGKYHYECPTHGRTVMIKANVDEPTPHELGGGNWKAWPEPADD